MEDFFSASVCVGVRIEGRFIGKSECHSAGEKESVSAKHSLFFGHEDFFVSFYRLA